MVSMTHISTSSEGIWSDEAMKEYGTERFGAVEEMVARVSRRILVLRTVDAASSMPRLESEFVSRKSEYEE